MSRHGSNKEEYDVIYHETFKDGPGVWTTGKNKEDGSWHRNVLGYRGEGLPVGWSKTGGRNGGPYVYSESPWYFDDNHGEFMWLHLIFRIAGEWKNAPPSVAKYYGGWQQAGIAGKDLRNAVIKASLRGQGLKLNGTRLFFWIQGYGGVSGWYQKETLYNWALTSQPIADALLDGEWHNIQLTLVNDESKWSQMGLIKGGLAGKIRVIQSLTVADGTLDGIIGGRHHNGGFILCGIDPNNPPTGRIEMSEISILAKKSV